MNLLKQIYTSRTYQPPAQKAPRGSGRLVAFAENEGYQNTPVIYQQGELYRRLSWVFTAVDTTSKIAAGVGFNVKKMRGEKMTDLDNHLFEILLRKPNPNQTRYEFLKSTYSFWLLTGNAYWHIVRSGENAPPGELWCIPPDRITRIITDDTMMVTGYEYSDGMGGIHVIPSWQVIHFKDFHPSSMFAGLSRVEPIAVSATTDLTMNKWTGNLYGKSNGRLPGFINFADPIDEPEWTEIKDAIKKGAQDANYVMLQNTGSGAISLLQAAQTLDKMQYIEGRTFTKEEIFGVFAPGLASMLAVNATEANSRTGKSTLIDFAVWPMVTMVGEKVTANILPAYTAENKQLSLIAEPDDIRVTDRALELQEITEFAKTHTVDEVREHYYEDKPLATITGVDADERGIMLIAQIGPSTPVPSDKKPDPSPIPPQLQPGALQPQPQDTPMPDQPPPGEQATQDQQQNQDAAMRADMGRWQRKALNQGKRGEGFDCDFVSEHIPAATRLRIKTALAKCADPDDVLEVFAEGEAIKADGFALLAMQLKRANDLLEAASAG